MSAMQRRKGQRGESELARLIHEHTGWQARRRVRQHEGDSDIEGDGGLRYWSIESKRAAKPNIGPWWRQTVEQAQRAGTLPVLFYRLDRQDWRAMWPIAVAMNPATDPIVWVAYQTHEDYTVTGSVAAWAMVAREVAAEHEFEKAIRATIPEDK